ncbi:MAG: hypothetical protein ACYSU1_05930 [Planctomycetota bacterium]
MLRRAFFLLLFLLSFFATAVWMRGLVPERLKIEWYQTVTGDADVLFLGSSHVFRQFDPALFDARRGSAEEGLRSYNLGTVGMELAEEIYLARRILRDKPESLRWIVLEAQPFDYRMRNLNDFGTRRIGWHDTATTWMLLQAIRQADLEWGDRLDLVRRHVEHWWRRTINLARGLDIATNWGADPMARFEDLGALGIHGDGYAPLDIATATQRNRAMRRGFLNAPGEMLRGRELLLTEGDGGPADPHLLEAVRSLEALAAEKGVGLVWWLHPNLERYPGWRQMEQAGEIEHLISYDDPKRFPDFYTTEWRFDLFHLNRRGAERMTADFADQFLQGIVEVEDR